MVINEEVDIDTQPIHMKELDTTIKRLKSHKAPGPDKCTTALFKRLNRNTKRILLHILNRIWEEEEAPEYSLNASVASLFKKGDIEDLANFTFKHNIQDPRVHHTS